MEEKEKKEKIKINNVAFSIKTISVLLMLIGVIGGILLFVLNISQVNGISYIIISIISGILMYAIGEFLQIMEDIKNKI